MNNNDTVEFIHKGSVELVGRVQKLEDKIKTQDEIIDLLRKQCNSLLDGVKDYEIQIRILRNLNDE